MCKRESSYAQKYAYSQRQMWNFLRMYIFEQKTGTEIDFKSHFKILIVDLNRQAADMTGSLCGLCVFARLISVDWQDKQKKLHSYFYTRRFYTRRSASIWPEN